MSQVDLNVLIHVLNPSNLDDRLLTNALDLQFFQARSDRG
jgi:hypothetical protein